ncbi:MAG: hypothetical protein GEU74_00465 [Nitriliruptorales bacterium]|nr:hypothetical protein [Nitriliruptorales bacterium]
MEESPFKYQGPLDPADVRGRDELLDDLIGRVTARRVTALVGPRRYGKTSLLRRLAVELTEMSTVWVDLYEVTSMADLVFRVDKALAAADTPFTADAAPFAASLQLRLGVARVEFSRPAKDRPDPVARLGLLLDVLVTTATRVPTLLILDEFSSIATVGGAAGALRTALQHHYTDLGIVFAGSMPSVMRQLFTNRVEPFYAQADLMTIGPLSDAAVTDMVVDGFAATGRGAGLLPGRLTEFAAGHPQRTMQLADAAWRHTPEGGSVDASTWALAVEEVRRVSADPMERLFSHFQRAERDVLRIVASGGAIFGNAAILLDVSHGAAAHARDRLLADGDLIESQEGLTVTDPVLADWIRTTLPL